MMKKKTNTKIGDIFSVQINEESRKFFQLIAFDSTQLNSDVIRVFKTEYPINLEADSGDITSDEVEFYAHCVTRLGIKLEYWEKYANSPDIGRTEHILFRNTNDVGLKPGEYMISNNWHIWKINDQNFTSVGKLSSEYQKAEIGLVINPASIVYRIKNGEYNFPFYPGY
jgi:hypothetical protein